MKSFRQLVRQSRRPWSVSKLRLLNNSKDNVATTTTDDDNMDQDHRRRYDDLNNLKAKATTTADSVATNDVGYVNEAFSGDGSTSTAPFNKTREQVHAKTNGEVVKEDDGAMPEAKETNKFITQEETPSTSNRGKIDRVVVTVDHANGRMKREYYRSSEELDSRVLKPVYTTNDYNNCAFVTLVMRDRNFCKGAEALAKSILFSNTRCRNLVCLVTPDIDRESRRRLELYYNKIVTVEYIELRCPPLISNNRDNVYGSWMDVAFTKLQCLKLFREYSKIIYLDCDSIVLQNIDHLFDTLSLTNKSAKDAANGQFYASFESCWSSELRRENSVPDFAHRQAVVPLNLQDVNICNVDAASLRSSFSSSILDDRKKARKSDGGQRRIGGRKVDSFIITRDSDDDDDGEDDGDDDNCGHHNDEAKRIVQNPSASP
ncbi:hypothetical protein KPH14_013065, partial [Odynerus spinipes]